MITHDVVGNLLTAMDYQSRVVYVDDRFDMYPEPLMDGYLELLGGSVDWRDQLDAVEADIVVWRRSEPRAQILAADAEWSLGLLDDAWVAYCRGRKGVV